MQIGAREMNILGVLDPIPRRTTFDSAGESRTLVEAVRGGSPEETRRKCVPSLARAWRKNLQLLRAAKLAMGRKKLDSPIPPTFRIKRFHDCFTTVEIISFHVFIQI